MKNHFNSSASKEGGGAVGGRKVDSDVLSTVLLPDYRAYNLLYML